MLTGEWIEKWYQLHGQKVRPSTIRGYRAALAHLSAAFCAIELDQMTPMDWECEIYRIKAQYPRQAELAHAGLRRAWKDAQRHKIISWENEPWRMVDPPKHQTKETLYLLPDEMTAYAQAAMQQPAAIPLLLMLLFGLRRGEALGLAWQDIDTREHVIHIRRQLIRGVSAPPKSSTSYRKIPIPDTIIKKIYTMAGDDRGYLLYNGSEKEVYRSHRAALAAARIEAPITLHGLRHSCATAMMTNGVDVKTIQGILGHASYNITADIYCHSLMQPKMDAISAQVTRLEIA